MDNYYFNFIANIVQNIIVSGVAVVFLKNTIEKKFSQLEKKDIYFNLILNDLRKSILKIKRSGVKIICLDGDTQSNFQIFFQNGGDFQMLIEENLEYFEYINKQRKKDVMHIERLTLLIELIKEVGQNMSNDEEECILKLREVINLCNKLLNEYNVLLVQ